MSELNFSGEYAAIPEHMREAIARYFTGPDVPGLRRHPPGNFLSALICNDLKNAVLSADETNLKLLLTYVHWFYWEAPGNSWGSPEKMEAWLNLPLKHRLESLTAATGRVFCEPAESK